MTREQALPYVSHCVDDALSERTIAEIPSNARLVGWQCGFERYSFAYIVTNRNNQPLGNRTMPLKTASANRKDGTSAGSFLQCRALKDMSSALDAVSASLPNPFAS